MQSDSDTERELRTEVQELRRQLAAARKTVKKREADLLAWEDLVRSIFGQADQALMVCDPRSRIIRASGAAQQLAGRDPLGLYFHQAFPLEVEPSGADGKSGPQSEAFFLAALEGETRQGVAATLHREDGRSFDLRVNSEPLYDGKGASSGCLISLSDVTERLQAEGERQQLLLQMEIQAEELRATNEDLAAQAEELEIQNEELLTRPKNCGCRRKSCGSRRKSWRPRRKI